MRQELETFRFRPLRLHCFAPEAVSTGLVFCAPKLWQVGALSRDNREVEARCAKGTPVQAHTWALGESNEAVQVVELRRLHAAVEAAVLRAAYALYAARDSRSVTPPLAALLPDID